jgi:hypothetical protein
MSVRRDVGGLLMTLPDTPFICENIDVEAAAKPDTGKESPCPKHGVVGLHFADDRLLGHTGPYCSAERYRTPWQPVVSDKEQQ